MDLLTFLLAVSIFVVGAEVGTTLISAVVKLIVEIKMTIDFAKNGYKPVAGEDRDPCLAYIQVPYNIFVPVSNLYHTYKIFSNYEKLYEVAFNQLRNNGTICKMSLLEQEIFDAHPTFLTFANLKNLVEDELDKRDCLYMHFITSNSDIYFHRASNGDIDVLHATGISADLSPEEQRQRVTYMIEMINSEMSKKAKSSDELAEKLADKKAIDFDKVNEVYFDADGNVTSVDGELTEDYLMNLGAKVREELAKQNQEEQSHGRQIMPKNKHNKR